MMTAVDGEPVHHALHGLSQSGMSTLCWSFTLVFASLYEIVENAIYQNGRVVARGNRNQRRRLWRALHSLLPFLLNKAYAGSQVLLLSHAASLRPVLTLFVIYLNPFLYPPLFPSNLPCPTSILFLSLSLSQHRSATFIKLARS